MSLRVLVADDSEIMRTAIRKVLIEEGGIDVVGEAASFAATMQLIADHKPDLLLLDLHLPEKRDFAPGFVKSQLVSVNTVLAISFSNDQEAKELAKSYGAELLLDKMKLYEELLPAMDRFAPARKPRTDSAGIAASNGR